MKTIKTKYLRTAGVLLTSSLAIACQAQSGKNNFTIEGTIKDRPVMPAIVYLVYDVTAEKPTDSAVVKDGSYTFHGHLEEPATVTVSTTYYDLWRGKAGGMRSSIDMAQFFLDKSTVRVVSTSTLSQAVITGSQAEVDYRQANKNIDLLMDSMKVIVKMARETKNDVLMRSIYQNVNRIEPMMKTDFPAFIRQHPASAANLQLIRQLAQCAPAEGWTESVDSLYHLLPANIRSGKQGRDVGTMLTNELKMPMGHKAPDFMQPDMNGHSVSLSSLQGKYVLLYFWASSDSWSLQIQPAVAKANADYGPKGLVVLGVSLDTDKNNWKQQILDSHLEGTRQVADLKGKSNAAAILCGVTKLPMAVLIDPHGTVIAKNLSQIAINQTLSSVFE